ncbi:MAG: Maf family protein [Candidatus Bipolaricaulaceae bacterium]
MISMGRDYEKGQPGAQRLVLASSSPRRADLLRLVVDEFEVRPPGVEEEQTSSPPDLLAVARRKAAAVQGDPDCLIIGADTGVFVGGRHFGKPSDRAEAERTLRVLSGGWHDVFTGLAVVGPGGAREALVETRVRFKMLSREEIDWYLSRESVFDKAGAYAIQGRAAAFVERLEGDYFNVVGLPVATVYRFLLELGWRPRPGGRCE